MGPELEVARGGEGQAGCSQGGGGAVWLYNAAVGSSPSPATGPASRSPDRGLAASLGVTVSVSFRKGSRETHFSREVNASFDVPPFKVLCQYAGRRGRASGECAGVRPGGAAQVWHPTRLISAVNDLERSSLLGPDDGRAAE